MNKSKTHFLGKVYKQFLGPVLAKDDGLDAEQLTHAALTALGQVSLHRTWPGIKSLLANTALDLQLEDCRLAQSHFGCHFKNPIGLAAGLDKNGVAAGIWDVFGFGFGID